MKDNSTKAYALCRADTAAQLEDLVNRFLAGGYELVGGPLIHTEAWEDNHGDKRGVVVYYQAVYFPGEEEE